MFFGKEKKGTSIFQEKVLEFVFTPTGQFAPNPVGRVTPTPNGTSRGLGNLKARGGGGRARTERKYMHSEAIRAI